MAADVIALMDRLEIPQAHIVGRSMGGMIAQILASEWPDRVLSLVSIMSATGNPAMPQARPEIMALLQTPPPDPRRDLDGFLANRVAFARAIAGSVEPLDESSLPRADTSHRGATQHKNTGPHVPRWRATLAA